VNVATKSGRKPRGMGRAHEGRTVVCIPTRCSPFRPPQALMSVRSEPHRTNVMTTTPLALDRPSRGSARSSRRVLVWVRRQRTLGGSARHHESWDDKRRPSHRGVERAGASMRRDLSARLHMAQFIETRTADAVYDRQWRPTAARTGAALTKLGRGLQTALLRHSLIHTPEPSNSAGKAGSVRLGGKREPPSPSNVWR